MADITKARNTGSNSAPVRVPLYDAPIDALYDTVSTFDVVNFLKSESNVSGKSVLSVLESKKFEFSDIEGRTVGMFTIIGGTTYFDVVKVIGCTNTAFVVEIDGIEYSVRKSIVRFTVRTE